MLRHLITTTLFLFSLSLHARLPAPAATTTAPSKQTQTADANDYTDVICQMVIEGNLSGLNSRINNGDFSNSFTSMKRILAKLKVPNGRGCVVNLMKSINLSMNEKGVDQAAELEQMKASSDQASAARDLIKKYPKMTQKNAQAVVTFLRSIKNAETVPTQTGEAAPVGQ